MAKRVKPTIEVCERIQDLGWMGWSLGAIADDIGVSRTTLQRWRKEHPMVREALESRREPLR